MTLGEHCGMRDLIPKLLGSYLIVVSVCGMIAETTTIAGLDEFIQANSGKVQLPDEFQKIKTDHNEDGDGDEEDAGDNQL